MRLEPGRHKRQPCILLAESDINRLTTLRGWIEKTGVHVIETTTATETLSIIEDTAHLEARLDGLLTSYQLSDALGHRVILDFRREFPNAPIAMLLDHQELEVDIWARAHRVQVLDANPRLADVRQWASSLFKQTKTSERTTRDSAD